MKRNLGTVLTLLDGKPLKGSDGTDLTLQDVCITALLTSYDDEVKLAGKDKVERYHLSQKIYANEEVDLTTEQIVKLKELIAKSHTPIVVGQAWDLLEQTPKAVSDTAEG